MKKYLEIIGIIELIGAIIAIIWYSIVLFQALSKAHGNEIWLLLAGYLAVLFFAPAVGLLFITVSGLMDDVQMQNRSLSKFKAEINKKLSNSD